VKKNLLLAASILLIFVVLLVLFQDQAQKLIGKIRPRPSKEVPSMIKTLPFKPKAQRRKKLLLEKLQPHELYLPNLILTPKGAPRGEYFFFSLVISFTSPEEAKRFREKKPLLESFISEIGSKFPYVDLVTPDGRRIFKMELLKRLQKKFGSEIVALWITDFRFKKVKGL